MCRRHHHCIVEKEEEEGGRHVVLYAFSHHSFFLYVDLFFLVLQEKKKDQSLYINKNRKHKILRLYDATRMNGIRRLLVFNLILFLQIKSGNKNFDFLFFCFCLFVCFLVFYINH